MPKMVCVKCERELVIVKIGALLDDMAYSPPETMAVASCDVFKCPECGLQIVAGFGQPIRDDEEIAMMKQSSDFTVRDFESNAAKIAYYKNREIS